ncbi:MAG: hypothetical protein K9N07_03285 [Candidatus Cloacimonetes bacterium]|nr:hypothetical protein [Candidatus Cloacimonadota bacterium]
MIFLLSIVFILLIILFYKNTVPVIDKRKKLLLIILRSISIIILLILLLNPIVYFVKSKIKKPTFIILSDNSESMEQKGLHNTKSEIFAKLINTAEKTLASNGYQFSKFQFADGIDGKRNKTLLNATFKQVFERVEPTYVKGILLFSDGWFNDKNLDVIENSNIPVYTFTPLFPINKSDLSISNIRHNNTAYKNESTPVKVDVLSHNYAGKAIVKFIANDIIVEAKTVDFSRINFFNLDFNISFAEVGFKQFEIKVISDSIEINMDNNQITGAINVKNDRSKCLMISDILDWDIKFISDAIFEDQHWQSKFLLKKDELMDGISEVSLEAEINDVNTLVLINNDNLSFSSIEINLINKFVENGGGMLMIGKPLAQLADVSAIIDLGIEFGFRSTISFTEESKKYNTFPAFGDPVMNNIPPVTGYFVRSKIDSEILSIFNKERTPAIVFHNVARGKVINFVFHDLWKWKLWEKSNVYNEFLLNILSWLGQPETKRFYSTLNKNSLFLNENVEIDLYAFDEKLTPVTNLNAKVSVTDDQGKLVFDSFMLFKDNKFVAEISELIPGQFKYVITDNLSGSQSEGEFIIMENSPEARDYGINVALLSYISNVTNGKLLKDFSELNLPQAKHNAVKQTFEFPIYLKWYIITIFLITFCLELFLRKRWGLL